MGTIYFYTGGARSGKSTASQKRAAQYADVAYIATAIDTDGEMRARIKKHVEGRPAAWRTYECPYEMAETIGGTAHEVYLIDCVTVYLTNLIFKLKTDWGDDPLSFAQQRGLEEEIDREVAGLLATIAKKDADFIIVSNEVGMGVVPAGPLGRFFRDAAGRANQLIASAATEVWLLVSGIPVKIKGGT